ncbi:MAG: hypothetical protein LPJ89_05170, partial [Hymenobacteraceae bacterium]|nr:hypothetical protein [Hymenobacteraceae bacterium]MDX5395427.1 hypothetical protein [Hymenobacteraceae bacterium]MDX5443158.1 hypothetical protein [Hymenobacteraceae bacterium]MDX5511476.1 hypothetical protein [Hymenobacteraceae bacterium]
MNNFNFWKNWHWELRFPYLFLLLLAVGATLIGVYHYFTGFDYTLRWETISALQSVDTSIMPFTKLLKNFSTDVNGYLLTEKFDASTPYLNHQAAAAALFFLACCLIFFLTIITTVKRLVYYAGILLLMLFMGGLNLDLLGVFSETSNYLLIITLAIFGISTYTFHAFWTTATFSLRLLVFTGIVAGLGAFIYTTSAYPPVATTLLLVNNASTGLFIASLLFMLLIAYENVHALLWLTTQAPAPERRYGFWPFFVIGLLYMLNLLLLFFKTSELFDLGLIYLDAFLILMLSIITGFWGLPRREHHYRKFFPFAPTASFLYLIGVVLTVLSIGYAFATANDPLIAAYDSVIVMMHLAYGFIFFIYILVNFGRLLSQKLAVHRIVYDPKRLPFFTVYLMGTILLMALLFRANFYVYDQVLAGYYNYMGDLYKATGDDMLAEQFYLEGSVYEHYNVKSNYSLAGIYRERNHINTEINFLKEALQKRPSEKVFARLANMYTSKDLFFEQQFVLNQALDTFPKSPQLNNNMALLYTQTNITDSVVYYLSVAEANASNQVKDVVQNNLLATYILTGLQEPAMELAEEHKKAKYLPLKSNVTLLYQLTGNTTKETEEIYEPADSTLHDQEFALFYNSVLQNPAKADTNTIATINSLLARPQNQLYDEDLTLLKAIIQQYNHMPNEAKGTLENLSAFSQNSAGYYLDVLGLWMLEKEQYLDAANYFRKSKETGYLPAFMHHAQALALAGKPVEAQIAVNKIYESSDKELINEALKVSELIGLESAEVIAQPSDSMKVQYLMVNRNNLIPLEVTELVRSIKNPELKLIAQKEQAAYLVTHGQPEEAQKLLASLRKNLKESELLSDVNLLQAELWAKNKNYEALKQVDQFYFSEADKPFTIYFKALLAEQANKPKEAQQLYDQIIKKAPYHEQGVLAAAQFYNDKLKQRMQAYEILLAGVTYNPFSAEMMKAYTLQSL